MKTLIAATYLLLILLLIAGPVQATKDEKARGRLETTTEPVPVESRSSREAAKPPGPLAGSGSPTVRYVPPRRGAPKTRVGGGTRTQAAAIPKVALLTPEHTGLTRAPSPVLYWWMSQDYSGEFEYVVTSLDAVEPELRVRYSGAMTAGIHALDLQAHELQLVEGRTYQWSVALIRDSGSRSSDVVALGTIERVADRQPLEPTPDSLAAAGLWYDSMESLGRLLSNPSEDARQQAAYRNMRAALLEQVQLPAIASWDRAAAHQG